MNDEPSKWSLPFRGGKITVWTDIEPGKLAIIAQLNLKDPTYDAFYTAAGVTLEDAEGNQVWPTYVAKAEEPEPEEPEPETEGEGDLFDDLFG